VPASRYVHPEFGFFCPAPRLRRGLRVLACLAMAGVGAAVMTAAERPEVDAAVTHVHEAAVVETVSATSPLPFAGVGTELTAVGPQIASDRPPAPATSGPRGIAFRSSCASRAWFGWRAIARQSPPLPSAAAPFPP
jgi:hypothetical protein